MNNVAKINDHPMDALSVIHLAIDKGQDPEKLEKLFDLYERDQKRIAEKLFNEALSLFQSELGPIIKKQQVDYQNKSGGKTSFDFANIDDIAQSIRPILSKYKLSYRFEERFENNFIYVDCVVSHDGGHSVKNSLSGPADSSGGKNAIQSIASTTTYLRRYTLTGALGITTGNNDNDGGKPQTTVEDLYYYNQVVRNNFDSISEMKGGIQNNNFEHAVQYENDISQEDLMTLWRAPSKGGIFTTHEISILKSDEYSKIRREFKQNNG